MKKINLNNSSASSTEVNGGNALFPIRILSEKTTVGTSTLRAWERRYGLLTPERTPKGHRLYSQKDVKRVSKILDLLDDGHSLPAIADMLSADSISESDPGFAQKKFVAELSSSVWLDFVESTLNATRDFNIERMDAIYNEATSLYPIDLVIEHLIQPVLDQLGTGWIEHPEKGIAEEHFYTSWLKNRIGARFQHSYSHAKGTRIVCACLPGSFHEVGLMLFALSALSRGYRVLYFGADLPLNQLSYIAARSASKAIVLGAHMQLSKDINDELVSTISELDTPVFIGGYDENIDTEAIQDNGGVLLGSNIPVALRIFEHQIKVYPQ
jgi:DNA-binding transcriptional MerR regulator